MHGLVSKAINAIPAFRDNYRIELAPGDGVFFFADDRQGVLTGSTVERVCGLIDGERSIDDIIREVAPQLSGQEARDALAVLSQNGLIFDAAHRDWSDSTLFWSSLGVDVGQLAQTLGAFPVEVIATPGINPMPFLQALEAAGVKTSGVPRFTVCVTDDYLHPKLSEINRARLASGSPWMIARPVGIVGLFGPIFQPGLSACWECLAARLRARVAAERFFDAGRHSKTLARRNGSANLQIAGAAQLVALHAAKWVGLADGGQLLGKIVSMNPWNFVSTTHIVVKRPQCPSCGSPLSGNNKLVAPQLHNRAKARCTETGHREVSAEETFARHQHHISPLSGIVSELAPSSADEDDVVKLFIASHNFSMDSTSPKAIRYSMYTKSCGKGPTVAQARTSALFEALERHAGVYQGDETLVRGKLVELGDAALHPNDCMLFSKQQYRDRLRWNTQGSPFNAVPDAFDPNAPVEWTPVWSLTAQSVRYMPAACLYYGYPTRGSEPFCWADSNGNAAGNSIEEAAVQGFLELVERDAVALWWYNRLRMPGLDMNRFDHPFIRTCQERYRHRGRDIWALDLTSDYQIPVVVALSRNAEGAKEEIIFGFGAHFDPTVALTRALAEMSQFLPAVSAPAGIDGRRLYAYQDQVAIRWWETATTANQSYVLPADHVSAHGPETFQRWDSNDHLVDLAQCVLKAQALGMETLLLDQTRPDVGVSVVKVIVPGMRHFWARFAPGRLYEVPCQMGLLATPTAEANLNPIPMFL